MREYEQLIVEFKREISNILAGEALIKRLRNHNLCECGCRFWNIHKYAGNYVEKSVFNQIWAAR